MLARRYAKLPSEIIETATTMDLQIFDIAVSYENYKHKLAQGQPDLTQEDMLEAIKKVRGA
jgi:CelD/BcsL family acetyltransferase involved in cellulose biosynthesis